MTSHSTPHKDVSALILSGGLGTRMGNVNKGLQTLQNRSLISHVIQQLQAQVSSIAINANQQIEAYQSFGLPILTDSFSGYIGPLAGMHAGLVHCQTPYMLCVPCDSPFLPLNLVDQLYQSFIANQADVAIACTFENEQTKTHNVICLLKTTLTEHLEHFIEQGGRKVGAWQASLKVQRVMFEQYVLFQNINSTEELQKAQLHINHISP